MTFIAKLRSSIAGRLSRRNQSGAALFSSPMSMREWGAFAIAFAMAVIIIVVGRSLARRKRAEEREETRFDIL